MTSQQQSHRNSVSIRWPLFVVTAGIVLLMSMAAYAAEGTWSDQYYCPGSDSKIFDFCTYQGQLVLAGQSSLIDGREFPGLAVWDGTTWSQIGHVANRFGHFGAVCEYQGDLYASGIADVADSGPSVDGLMAYDGADWRIIAEDLGYMDVNTMYEYGGDLIIGGQFTTVGEDTVNNIVRYDGSALHAFGDGLLGHYGAEVNAIVEFEGQLVAGGRFYIDSSNGGVAYWNDPNWSILGDGIHLGLGWVEDMIVFNNLLYVCGLNLSVNDTMCCVATFDGLTWAVADSGLGPSEGKCREFEITGGHLYVGGLFYKPDSNEVSLAMLDGDVWVQAGPDIYPDGNGGVYAMQTIGDTLYLGGEIFGAGTLAGNDLLSWDGTAFGQLFESPIGLGCNGSIYELAEEGGYLYAMGDFTTIGGVVSSDIARWNGSAWESMVINEYSTYMSAVATYNGDLHIGGAFYNVGPDTADKIARWDGSNWRALPDLPIMNVVRSMLVHHDTLFVGTLSWGLYAWDGAQWSERLIEGGIYDLAVLNDTLYAAGVGLKPSDSDLIQYCALARRVDDTWYSVGDSIEYFVSDMMVDGDDLWVVGEFHEAGGDSAKSIAIWEGDHWNVLEGGPIGWGEAVPKIEAITHLGDNIAVCGQFYTVDGVDTCFNIALWDGASWSQLGGGVPFGTAYALAAFEGDLMVGGSIHIADGYYIGGLARWSPTATGIEIDNPPELPTGYNLLQNYPNPFNPTTTIAYQLPRAGDVRLDVLNVLGQTVRVLVDKKQTAGDYTVEWDGCSVFNTPVASGVYFYRLSVDDYVESRKMILLK